MWYNIIRWEVEYLAKKVLIPKNSEVMLTFLEKTKNGDYSPIERSSLPYARLNEKDESSETNEQIYSFSLS